MKPSSFLIGRTSTEIWQQVVIENGADAIPNANAMPTDLCGEQFNSWIQGALRYDELASQIWAADGIEQCVDWSFWVNLPAWTIVEGAALVLGFCPDLAKQSDGQWDHPDNRELYDRTLKFAQRYAKSGGRLTDPDTPSNFVRWAIECEIGIHERLAAARQVRFARIQQINQIDKNLQEHDSEYSWPWGKRSTNLLNELASAAKEHWSDFDPKRPKETAPKSEVVERWLNERGVAKRVAESMAQILRDDSLKS